jgi:secreted trypsin-like serine protease
LPKTSRGCAIFAIAFCSSYLGAEAGTKFKTVVTQNESSARYTVALQMKTPDGSDALCSGVLIGSNLVLTAAHCVDPMRPDRVRFGLNVSRSESRPVSYVARPREYRAVQAEIFDDDQLRADIAVVIFKGSLPKNYEPISINDDPSLPLKGKKLLISGFGASRGCSTLYDQRGFGRLMKTVLPVTGPGPVGQIKVTFHSGRYCKGDSGGPAVLLDQGWPILVGIVSAFDVDGIPPRFGLLTRISTFCKWIEGRIREAQNLSS